MRPWLVPSPERTCTATKSNGEPCKRWAIAGGSVCATHGGSIGRVKAAAERRLAAERLVVGASEMGKAIDTSAPEALEEMLAEAAGMVVVLRDKIATFDDPTTKEARITLARYDMERDRLQRFAKDFTTLGLAERKQVLHEAEVERFYQALQRALAAVLSPELVERVKDELAQQLQVATSRRAITVAAS